MAGVAAADCVGYKRAMLLGNAASRAIISGVLPCLVLAACAPEPVALPPRLEFVEPLHDAGRVTQGERVVHRFDFRNAGGRELRLRDVRVSCDCAARIDAGDVVPPDGTGAIELELSTLALSGAVQRTASVFSNDPQTPVFQLQLIAVVEPRVAIEPRELYVGRVAPGTQATTEASIAFADGSDARALSVESEGTVAQPRWTSPADPGNRRFFSVVIAPDAPTGPFVETIVIRTSHPDRPRIEVKVAGVVTPNDPEFQPESP